MLNCTGDLKGNGEMTTLSRVIQLKIHVDVRDWYFQVTYVLSFLPTVSITHTPHRHPPQSTASPTCLLIHFSRLLLELCNFTSRSLGQSTRVCVPNRVHFCGRGAGVAERTWALQTDSSPSKPGSATFWLYDLGQVTTLWSLSFHIVKWENRIYLAHLV